MNISYLVYTDHNYKRCAIMSLQLLTKINNTHAKLHACILSFYILQFQCTLRKKLKFSTCYLLSTLNSITFSSLNISSESWKSFWEFYTNKSVLEDNTIGIIMEPCSFWLRTDVRYMHSTMATESKFYIVYNFGG